MKRRLLREAERIARVGLMTHPEWANFMHWSFIVQGDKLVEWGTNRTGSAPPQLGYDKTRHKLHAEVSAYKRARGLIDSRCSWQLINLRLNRRGEWRISAPCALCSSWLSVTECDKVWFTTPGGWAQLSLR